MRRTRRRSSSPNYDVSTELQRQRRRQWSHRCCPPPCRTRGWEVSTEVDIVAAARPSRKGRVPQPGGPPIYVGQR